MTAMGGDDCRRKEKCKDLKTVSKAKNILNLEKFPHVETSIPFLKCDPLKEFPKLLFYEDIAERVYGCNTFIGSNADKEYPNFSERAHFRVALSEFVSISEIIKTKYKAQREMLSIEKTDFPLFHFFKLLREVTFHLMLVENDFHSVTLTTIDTKTSIVSDLNIEANHFIIKNCSIDLFFAKKKEINNSYNKTELLKVIAWVDQYQIPWGITYLLERALRQYCEWINAHIS